MLGNGLWDFSQNLRSFRESITESVGECVYVYYLLFKEYITPKELNLVFCLQ